MTCLRDKLRSVLSASEHEWPPRGYRYFVPYSIIEKLVDEDSVREMMSQEMVNSSEDDIRHYTALILSSCKRLFTIMIRTPDINLSLLRDLLEEGISDRNLPFSRVFVSTLPSDGHQEYILGKAGHDLCKEAAHKDCAIKSLSSLNQEIIKDICGRQWSALAPIFEGVTNGIVHYDFEFGTILPYIEDSEREKSKPGGFGEVWSVKIHPAHQKLLPSSDPKGLDVAVKGLFSTKDQEEIFNLEVKMLQALNRYSHKHIIKLLATYKLTNRYYLLFPLASCNLRNHWDTRIPLWNQPTYLWAIMQLKGLVSALDVIHTLPTGLPSMEPDIPNAGTSHRPLYRNINLRVEQREAMFGRHGDIKPENILWFEDSADVHGTLVLADMGLGRFHRKESRSRVDPKTINGSQTYAPPEVTMNQPVSRAYDIWSLGCVLTEFITWLLKGPPGLAKFGARRLEVAEDGIKDDTFFTITSSGSDRLPTIRPGVSNWIRELKQDERCSPVFEELLDVVEWNMLRVDPRDRISAEDLKSSINAMIREASGDAKYLMGVQDSAANDEQGIKMATGMSDEVKGAEVPVIEVNGPSS
ncbi:putative cyclin-dependent kinase 2 [Rhexocercosporidium sp. MPI-PUGE-AT-0058]|nr:putative cyclin-dependent kinase 2 [Rhexocercosporidium sp. MPI-PUGE-AT-0058]